LSRFNRSASVMVVSNGQTATIVSGLRITFKVVKTRDKSLNSARIEIYNLSENTRNLLSAPKAKIILNAGYLEDEVSTVFKGDIVRAYTLKRPPEVVTVIDALDGRTASLTKLSVGYPAGTSAKTILNDVARISGLTSANLPDNNRTHANGFSFTGLARDVLTKCAKLLGVDWSIQNDTLKCVPVNQSDNSRVQVLSVDTGLIESPVKIGNIDPTKQSTSIDGWKVTHLLLPSVEPGNKIVIKSQSLSSEVYSVATIEHNGDNFGDDWSSTLEVQEIRGMVVRQPIVEAKFK